MFCLLSLRCLGQITFFEKRTKHGYITQREFPKGERFQTHWYSLYLEPQSTTPIKSRQCGWSPLTLRVQYRNPICEAPNMLQLECIVSNLQSINILFGRNCFFLQIVSFDVLPKLRMTTPDSLSSIRIYPWIPNSGAPFDIHISRTSLKLDPNPSF